MASLSVKFHDYSKGRLDNSLLILSMKKGAANSVNCGDGMGPITCVHSFDFFGHNLPVKGPLRNQYRLTPQVFASRMTYDQAALNSGLRYAWSRLEAHAHLLDVLESHFDDEQFPSAVIEPGCFTGGLIHFLAMKLADIPHIAFDMSPRALKVASKLAEDINHPNSLCWLEANFLQVTPEQLSLIHI